MQPYSGAPAPSHGDLPDVDHPVHAAELRAALAPALTSFATATVARRTRFFLHAREMFCTIDRAGTIVDANPACAEGLGISAETLRGMRLTDLLAEAARPTARQALASLSAGSDEVSFGAHLSSPGGIGRRLVWHISADREAGLFYAVGREADAPPRDELAAGSAYDLVTGLLNRFSFAEQIAQLVAAHGRNELFALCVIDLDHFSRINDSLGHLAGDDVLAMVAERLRQVSDPAATLARMGGDEFAMILPGADGPTATRTACRLLAALDEPLYAGGLELYISASAGISLYPRDGADATTLLKHADSAMYRAKAGGPNSVSRYEPALGRANQARLELDNQLRRAIDRGQFLLHYQPQISLRRGAIVGVESLIRWQHPGRGLIHPQEFIAAAEEHHLMPRIADWVLAESCRQAASWQREGRPPIRIAVNVSARQFEHGDIVERVGAALAASGLDPHRLDLEITESMLMHDPDGSAQRIRQLRALGVRVTLDDFGTGYSSLTYLQRFPVDALKVDRSFVAGVGPGADNRASGTALVQAIVGLAHSLGLEVLAEGVETLDQHMLLRAIGCDEAQGYLYARPLPADKLWAARVALPR